MSERAEERGTYEKLIGAFAGSAAVRGKFSTLSHAPTKTSAESARVRGASVATGAKAMLLKAGKPLSHGTPYVLAVLSAARRADLKVLRAALNQKSLSLASVDDVWKLTRCVPGAVPPFGSIFDGVMTVVDTSITGIKPPFINFNAGLRTESVLGLAVADYLAFEKPAMTLSFSEADASLDDDAAAAAGGGAGADE